MMFGRSSGKDKVLGSFVLRGLVILFSMLCGAVAVRAMTARARELASNAAPIGKLLSKLLSPVLTQ